jgi:hypothetical protein
VLLTEQMGKRQIDFRLVSRWPVSVFIDLALQTGYAMDMTNSSKINTTRFLSRSHLLIVRHRFSLQ